MTAIAQPLRFPSPGGVVGMAPSSSVPGTSSTQGGQLSSAPVVQTQPFQPYYLRPAYRFKVNAQSGAADVMSDGPGRRLRKNVANVRRHIDYISNVLNHVENRLWQYGHRDRLAMQADVLYHSFALPPSSTQDKPVDCVLTKFVRAAMNKVKCPIYSICWTPEGKRLITGASTGEFTLWNGTAFNFETILQAHDSAIRALKWSHNDQWLVSADHDGFVKYWQPNMNNVHMYQAHKDEPIRSLSFAPSDGKLVTGSDDGTARIWDFARCAEERILRGHGSDVRSVDWHPQKGLICTGSRDSQQPVKLWDPKSAQCLATLHDHKNSVMSVQWNKNGNWLLTGSRDHLVKMYDIRMMREMHSYRGHKKEVTAVAWHPVHESLFVSGGGDGSLAYWLVNSEKELSFLEHAHDQAIWTLEWHPLGHILASGSNDNNTKFWARNRPGDTQDDIFGLSTSSSVQMHAVARDIRIADADSDIARVAVIPGMGLDEDVYEGMQRREANVSMSLVHPSNSTNNMAGPLLYPDDPNARQQTASIGAKKTLIKQPPPKKAQRQFERMWNVAKPAGGGGVADESEDGNDDGAFRRQKTSLLGPPPPSMLSAKPSEAESPFAATHAKTAVPGSGPPQVSVSGMAAWQGTPAKTSNIQQINPPNGTQMRPAPVITQELLPPNIQQHMHLPPLPFPQPTATAQLMWPPPLGVGVDRDYRMGAALMMPPLMMPGPGTSTDVDLRNEQQPSSSWRPHASPPSSVSADKRDAHDKQAPIRDPRRRPTPSQHTKENRPFDNANYEQDVADKAAKRSTWMPDVNTNERRALEGDRAVPSGAAGDKLVPGPPPSHYSPGVQPPPFEATNPHYRPPPPQYVPVSAPPDASLCYAAPEHNSPYGSVPGRNSPYGSAPERNSPYGGTERTAQYEYGSTERGGTSVNYAQRYPFNRGGGTGTEGERDCYQQGGGGAMRRSGPLIDRRAGRGRGRGGAGNTARGRGRRGGY